MSQKGLELGLDNFVDKGPICRSPSSIAASVAPVIDQSRIADSIESRDHAGEAPFVDSIEGIKERLQYRIFCV